MSNPITEIMASKPVRRWVGRPNHAVTVGILRGSERTVWSNGATDGTEDGTAAVYEIGSITKTMIGLLFAIGEQAGKWSRTDKIADYRSEWSSNEFANTTTMLQLLTHTSGLPRMPANFNAAIDSRMNPYRAYRDAHLIKAVAAERPKNKFNHSYSNYGYGLLGWLLAGRLGMSVDEALRHYVLHPLGMKETAAGAHPEVSAGRVLPVYTAAGRSAPHWDFLDTMAGAGAVRSTVPDMLRYLQAYLSHSPASLGAALAASCEERHSIFPGRGVGIGYGWMRTTEKDGSVTHWHNGGTYGSSSFAAFNLDHAFGLVLMSNYGAGMWSQLAPLIGIRMMSADMLAGLIMKKLMKSRGGD